MALIKCSECGKEISDKAHHCPHCGNVYRKRTLQTKKEKSLAFKILIPIISSIAAFVFFIMAIILIDKVPEKIQEKKILNQIVGSWKYTNVSQVNGGKSYDIITFAENKTFKQTSGFIFEGNDDFNYGIEGTLSIYSDGEMWLYTNDGEFVGHFKYDSNFDELYELNDNDGTKKQYDRY